ncbi:MAG: recombinase family protein [Pseudomonas sp.]
MALVGYARVSTNQQETRIQLVALRRAGVRSVVSESRSGVGPRPKLDEIVSSLRPGDVLVVYRLDRLGRSLGGLLDLFNRVRAAGATVRSLTEAIDTSTPLGQLVVHVLGSIAQFEREVIRERCMAGQAAARARGQVWGRPRVLGPEDEAGVVSMYQSGWFTIDQIAIMLGVSRGVVRGPLCRAGLISSSRLGQC